MLSGQTRSSDPSVPSWDLALVLGALAHPPFEPLISVGLRELSLKTVLLLTLASVKCVQSTSDNVLGLLPRVSR